MECQVFSWLRRISTFVVTLTVCCIVTSCSSTKFAYQFADKGIIWWVDDYISMTDDQEDQLKLDIRDLQDWHCREELPRYSQWLAELKQDVRSGHLHRARVSYHQEQLSSFVPPLLDRAKPAIKRLLSSLSDKQVKELADNMAESQAELEDEFLGDDQEQTRQALKERTKRRLERWLGTLNDAQSHTLEQWSFDRVLQTKIWLEGRRIWQKELLEALGYRKEKDFDNAIDYLIDNEEEARGPEHQQMALESRVSMTDLLTALLEESDQEQLDYLLERATELRDDFGDLSCTDAGDHL